MEPASRELLERYEAGDPLAARQIYDRYAARLLGLARRMLAEKLAARIDPEDVVQSAYRSFFLHARTGRYTLRESGDLWRLLIAITRHKTLHAVERNTAAKRSPVREAAASDFIDREVSPQEVTALADELAATFQQLEPLQRQLLELRLRETPLDEIAKTLKKSPRTVRRMLLEIRRLCERRWLDHNAEQLSRLPAPRIDRVARLDYRDFVLEQLVGAGGFGKVYRAFWKSHQQTVAVKSLRKQFLLDRRAVERFVAEAQTIASLDHPGIIRSHGLGRTPAGGYFLVLDWHPGGDLTQCADLTPGEIMNFVAQAAAAVHDAHQRGIVHCDLKPSNLLLDAERRVVVTDFGFAQAMSHAEDCPTGGTLGFIAPEHLQGAAPAPAADIFSLGCVLAWLLTKNVRQADPYSQVLKQLAKQCQARNPAQRPTIAELILRLGQIADIE